jgi:hypothetical protein
MLMRRDAFKALNGFNEDLSVAFNDVDLCIRLRNAGWAYDLDASGRADPPRVRARSAVTIRRAADSVQARG